jgi:transcriptional regulator with XRE-family HTH domain
MPPASLQQRLGAAIQLRRIRLGVSQEVFADVVGMHRTQYGAIEQGRKDCRLSTLQRIADGLQVRLSVLIAEME